MCRNIRRSIPFDSTQPATCRFSWLVRFPWRILWLLAGPATVLAGPEAHWAFQPVRRPPVPEVQERAWVRNPIDAFILAKLEAAGEKPAPPASAAVLLRRAHLDLIGLPPTLEDVEALTNSDRNTSGSADEHLSFDRFIDDLLARPAYGERWARHWLDLVRYADSNGYERDAAKPFVWRYRDYVIRSLNADKPLDRFIIEQIAGDELRHRDRGNDHRHRVSPAWALGR